MSTSSDFTVVASDDATIVVETKKANGDRVRYGLPKRALDVVFTSGGIVRGRTQEPASSGA